MQAVLMRLKRPFILARYPGLFVSVAMAALVTASASMIEPLFLSSAGSAALRGSVEEASTWDAGLTVTAYGNYASSQGATVAAINDDPTTALFTARTDLLRRLLSGAPGLDPMVVTIVGSTANVFGSSSGGSAVRLVARSGFARHVEELAAGGSPGVWVPRSVARVVHVQPNDLLMIRTGDHETTVPVQGVYANPSVSAASTFWAPLLDSFGVSDRNTPLLLMEPEVFHHIATPLRQVVRWTWQFPVSAQAMPLGQASRVADRIRSVQALLDDRSNPQVQTLFAGTTNRTGIPDVVRSATVAVARITGTVDALTLAGRCIGLALVGAAAVFAVRRRRVEMEVLSARGLGPAILGLGMAGEAVLPLAIGATGGWFLGRALVRWLGPTGATDSAANLSAVSQVGWTSALAIALFGLIAGYAAVRSAGSEGLSRIREILGRVPWDVPLLLAAAVAYTETAIGGSPASGAHRVDVIALLFPVLFVAGVALLSMRSFARFLPRIRSLGSNRSIATYFASRRLAAATRGASLLVTAGAVSLGTLSFAGSVVVSLRQSVDTKALVLNGSETRVELPEDLPPSMRWPFPATIVERIDDGAQLTASGEVLVLGIDPSTFLDAADPATIVGPSSPTSLIPSLAAEPGGRAPTLSTGEPLHPLAVLTIGHVQVPLRGLATATTLPGMTSGRVVILVDRRALDGTLRDAGTSLAGVGGEIELWAKAPAAEVLAGVRRAGARPGPVTTLGMIRRRPEFAAVAWMLDLLLAVGCLAALVTALAVVLFLQARQRARQVSYALATRMGLRRGDHRRSALFEIVGLLGASFVLGTVPAMVAAAAVVGGMDPVPRVPPAPTIGIPVELMGVTAAGLIIVATVGAWLVQLQAQRANMSEVMRASE